jgi:hypothetical protein
MWIGWPARTMPRVVAQPGASEQQAAKLIKIGPSALLLINGNGKHRDGLSNQAIDGG